MNRRDSILEQLEGLPLKGLDLEAEISASERLDAIRALSPTSLRPVRPLPSNTTLTLFAVAGFVAFSALATIPVGFAGYHRLLLSQKLLYYAVIVLSAALLSASIVKEIIPGSKFRLSPGLSMALGVVSVALVALSLFPRPDFHRFTEVGLPCLELGTVIAAITGFLASLLLRKGFSSSPARMSLTTGFFAGLSGFAVLALHCPVQNMAHILVWHLGAMLVGAAGGALIGLVRPVTP